jgi:DNA ligase (NAD+)
MDVQVGRTGRITPMARINPVRLSGSVIQNVTLHNQDYIDSLELAVGDTVAISKRGDVIPAVESVIEKNSDGNTTWVIPPRCPVCGSAVERRGAHHFCTGETCPAKEKGSIEYFCAKKQMDIEGLGPQTVDYLYDKGYIHTIADLYRFDFKSLVNTEKGFGLKKTQAIEEALKESRKRPFKRVLAGLGMNEFSHNVIQILEKAGYRSKQAMYDLVSDTDKAQEIMKTINGIGPLTGAEIIKGLTDQRNRALLDELETFGLCMDDGVQKEEEPAEEQIFAGQSWCVTGTFDNFQPRDKAMEEIKKRGGTEVSSVSRKTTCLLAGKNAGSKLEKAREYGVKIVDEQEFLQMIGGSDHGHESEDQDLFGEW